MPRLVETPEPVVGQLPAGGEQRGFAERVLKSLKRFRRIAEHEVTEAVELRQIARELRDFFALQGDKFAARAAPCKGGEGI